jgi:hypothetical protein
MPLVDEINNLRREILAALDDSHDFYTHTKIAWRLVQHMSRQGRQITIRNRATGSILQHEALPRMAQRYVGGDLATATFQQFVSVFEDFLLGFLRRWLNVYPFSLASRQLEFRTVLDATNRSEIIGQMVERELARLAYERMDAWFAYIEKLVHLDCPNPDQISRLAEIKATRNALIHNQGVANALYLDRSLGRARFREGEQVLVPEAYHRESWQLIRQVVEEMSRAAVLRL